MKKLIPHAILQPDEETLIVILPVDMNLADSEGHEFGLVAMSIHNLSNRNRWVDFRKILIELEGAYYKHQGRYKLDSGQLLTMTGVIIDKMDNLEVLVTRAVARKADASKTVKGNR